MPCFIRAESGSVRFVSANVANTESVTALPKSLRRSWGDNFGGVEASDAVGRREYVTWKNQPERVRVTFTVLPQNVPVTVTV